GLPETGRAGGVGQIAILAGKGCDAAAPRFERGQNGGADAAAGTGEEDVGHAHALARRDGG
ncbi:hypothetical protein MMB00_24455, partial [Salmonella enterica]|nr:hypothetical protein [Salmonella enterica]